MEEYNFDGQRPSLSEIIEIAGKNGHTPLSEALLYGYSINEILKVGANGSRPSNIPVYTDEEVNQILESQPKQKKNISPQFLFRFGYITSGIGSFFTNEIFNNSNLAPEIHSISENILRVALVAFSADLIFKVNRIRSKIAVDRKVNITKNFK